MPRPGLRLAGAGSPAAFCRECETDRADPAPLAGMSFRLGNEPAQNRRGNSPVGRALGGAFR